MSEEFNREICYSQNFQRFLECCGERNNLMEWLGHNSNKLQLENVQTLLSIGGGTGNFDLQFVEYLPKIKRYTVVEPNAQHINIFKQEADGNPIFEFHQQNIEHWHTTSTYDMALVSQAMYYFKDRQKVLRFLAGRAKRLLFIHQTEFGINEIQKLFGDAFTQPYIFNSLDIVKELDNLNFESVRYRIDGYIDVNDPDQRLVDFFLEKPASAEERESVRNYLSDQFSDGRMYHPVDVILAQR